MPLTLLEPTLLSLPQEGIEAAFTVDWERDRRWEIVGERETGGGGGGSYPI
jgi:hypothetical protein